MRNRRIAFGAVMLLLFAAALQHPSSNIRVITHQRNDPAPHQVSVAVDLGVMAISFLFTWSGKRFATR